MVDVVLATWLAVLLSPLMLAIALAVRLSSRGPIFFAQDRIGLRGRRFRMLKFRTMRAGVRRYARSPASSSDPRLTRIGSWLRRFSLDELPQLWNVVRGEMSLVGPRPEMPYIVRRYSREERRRLEALPGITGLWQISHARACPIHHNLQYDLEYIARRSLAFDLIIL
ncbi:MAG TPA: sugar transferase, partial [Candidatus Koribacter sp.]